MELHQEPDQELFFLYLNCDVSWTTRSPSVPAFILQHELLIM